ncbi:Pectin lyase-like superfamily protein [Citrus sinensis]|nr:Pectin lyase-like superfamily protein [Citrus sinensis]
MRGLSFRSLAFLFLIAFLVWSASFETCNARRGRHWRHGRSSNSVSLSKKNNKGNTHRKGGHHNYHNGKPKPKPKPKPKAPSHNKSPPLAPAVPTKPVYDVPPPSHHSSVFNVKDFGAKGNGVSDDTKAFEAAWAAACKVEASIMVVPAESVFLVGPMSFSGPYCQANIIFQLDGTIIAPTGSKDWGKGLLWWLDFTKLKGITIQGKGIIDGRGSVWWQDYPLLIFPCDSNFDYRQLFLFLLQILWQIRSELSGKMPSIKPTALRFYGSFNVTVTGITIQNSPQCHLKFDNCIGVVVHDVSVSSPGDSPNTDGIHLQNSKDVLIHTSNLACGDDCVSIQTGCSNVYVHNVNCGPGHGITCVSNITVRDVMMHNTMNGVRIKTWQGGSGSVQGVLFSNIQVSEVQLPIVIDQFYCDKSTCKNQTSAVALSGITYERVKGTYTVKPVHFACSDSLPCVDVTLSVIELKPVQERYHMYDPYCWQAFGESTTPTHPPIACLQKGKRPSNRPQSSPDACF